jgi:hypothetical protein
MYDCYSYFGSIGGSGISTHIIYYSSDYKMYCLYYIITQENGEYIMKIVEYTNIENEKTFNPLLGKTI